MVNEPSRGVTLGRVAATARALNRLRVPIMLVAVASAAWFVWILMDTAADSARALVPLALLLWALLALGVSSTLTKPPQPIAPDDPLLVRLKKRLVRLAYRFAIVLLVVLVAMTLLLSYRAWQLT